MSDVFSFGVVLLELITGRRSMDKNRPSREQNLVEWARPLLKDSHKLERIMDPRLEGQYSNEGARKAALLAYQCLSQHPKSRPTMRNVVKTLEPLLDLKDIPIGPFVYIVPSDESINSENCVLISNGNGGNECDMAKNGNKDEQRKEEGKKEKSRPRYRKSRHRHRIRSFRSQAVCSDTDLYKTLGTSLYTLDKNNWA